MKKSTYTYITIILSILVSSCGNDFLNLTPHSNANEDDFYRTKSEIETAMTAAYSTLHDIYHPIKAMYFFGALSSDDAYTDDQGTGAYKQFEFVDVKANNPEVLNQWNLFYSAINKINKVILNAEIQTFNDKETYIAEMKFLRSLYYFYMVQIWGGVPLITKPISIVESYAIRRASEEDIYTLIITDLEYGIQHLQKKGNERAVGVPTKGSAYALLGKVYLTKGDKNKAAEILLNIYNSYSLTPNYADLWDINKKNGSESIFEIQYLGGASNAPSTYWSYYTPSNNLGSITLQGGGHNQVTDDLWNDYELNDPRRDISIQDGWLNKQGVFIPTRYPIKWYGPTESYVGKHEASDNNFIILRYADVLLMLTEATDDPKYLNEVRARVGLPLYGTAEYPSDKYPTLAMAIEHERRVELAMEFHRFFDLKRTGRAIDVLKNSGKQLISITENNLYWPIPEVVIDQNPNLWESQQNPGY